MGLKTGQKWKGCQAKYIPDDSQKIIAETKEPYRGVFRFLMRCGLGLDEFTEIQGSPEIQSEITKQINDRSRAYVRIDLSPRKSNPDTFYTLIQKPFVPHFPIRTRDYGTRGNQLVTGLDLEMNWLRARKRAGLGAQIGLGPHTLRSTFRSQCALLGVSDAVAEFCMRHGTRESYGYSREMENESYVVGELSKLWDATIPVTAKDLDAQERTIADLRKRLDKLEAVQTESHCAPPRRSSEQRKKRAPNTQTVSFRKRV